MSIKLYAAALLALTMTGVRADEAGEAEHAHHHHARTSSATKHVVDYAVPELKLLDMSGRAVSLRDELNDGRPVVMNFIFTTCAAICPLMSQVFSGFQDRLDGERDKVHLVSISIDPEQDTPARLVEYAKKFHAGPEWSHYTGSLAASVAAQRAFGVYRGDKMSHTPVTLIRAAPGKSWVRIDGFVTPDELLDDYRQALSAGT